MRISSSVVSLLLMVSLIVVGCGGDDGSEGGSETNGMDAGKMDVVEPDGSMDQKDVKEDANLPRFEELGSCPTTVTETIAVGGGSQNEYTPADVTISPGDVIKWQWAGGLHDVTADNDADCSNAKPDWFESQAKSGTSHTFCVRFNEAGAWNYQCTVGDHCEEGMKGVITVE